MFLQSYQEAKTNFEDTKLEKSNQGFEEKSGEGRGRVGGEAKGEFWGFGGS